MNTVELGIRLEQLLSESMESVLIRQNDTLENIIGSLDNEFILFGAGNLGRKALDTLKRIEKIPAGFIDNNPLLWGKEIEGIPIMCPADASKIFDPAKVGVIITIWCGEATDKMSDRIEPLIELGFRNIALFGHLAWKFSEDFLPHYSLDLPSKIIQQSQPIREAFILLSDDESRELFINHIEWRLFLNYDKLPSASKEEIYFNSKFINNLNTEVLYDIGAYIGDSIEGFLNTERAIEFSQIHSFEPSTDNFLKLECYILSLGRALQNKIFSHKLALGDAIGHIQVEADYGPASRVGIGEETVPMTTIDAFSESFVSPTFIKMDIEGFEPQCLLGARQTIKSKAPVVAVCVYHMQSHIWEILLQLHSYYPDYHYSLCPHLADGWDLVLYAVPNHRLPV